MPIEPALIRGSLIRVATTVDSTINNTFLSRIWSGTVSVASIISAGRFIRRRNVGSAGRASLNTDHNDTGHNDTGDSVNGGQRKRGTGQRTRHAVDHHGGLANNTRAELLITAMIV